MVTINGQTGPYPLSQRGAYGANAAHQFYKAKEDILNQLIEKLGQTPVEAMATEGLTSSDARDLNAVFPNTRFTPEETVPNSAAFVQQAFGFAQECQKLMGAQTPEKGLSRREFKEYCKAEFSKLLPTLMKNLIPSNQELSVEGKEAVQKMQDVFILETTDKQFTATDRNEDNWIDLAEQSAEVITTDGLQEAITEKLDDNDLSQKEQHALQAVKAMLTTDDKLDGVITARENLAYETLCQANAELAGELNDSTLKAQNLREQQARFTQIA